MQAVAQSSSALTAGEVNAVVMWNTLAVSMPISNRGPVAAMDILITEAVIDSSLRTQVALPWSLGDVAPGKRKFAVANFALAGLAPGERHVVKIAGTCKLKSGTERFTFTSQFVVPGPTSFPVDLLAAGVKVNAEVETGLWTYTLVNQEAPATARVIYTFSLQIAAPFAVRGTPKGWEVITDNMSYIVWHASVPGKGVPPGETLSGFTIYTSGNASQGTSYALASWNRDNNQADRPLVGTVLAPAVKRP